MPEINGKMLRRGDLWNCDDSVTPKQFAGVQERCFKSEYTTKLRYENKELIMATDNMIPDALLDRILYYGEYAGYYTVDSGSRITVSGPRKFTSERGVAQSIIKCRDYFLHQNILRPENYYFITGIYCFRCERYAATCLCDPIKSEYFTGIKMDKTEPCAKYAVGLTAAAFERSKKELLDDGFAPYSNIIRIKEKYVQLMEGKCTKDEVKEAPVVTSQR